VCSIEPQAARVASTKPVSVVSLVKNSSQIDVAALEDPERPGDA
jgi:hypothetical protein